MGVSTHESRCPQRPEEGMGSLRARIIGRCELPNVSAHILENFLCQYCTYNYFHLHLSSLQFSHVPHPLSNSWTVFFIVKSRHTHKYKYNLLSPFNVAVMFGGWPWGRWSPPILSHHWLPVVLHPKGGVL